MADDFGACGGCGCPDIEIYECEECERPCCSECGRFDESVWCDTAECWAEMEAKADKAREEALSSMPAWDDEAGAF